MLTCKFGCIHLGIGNVAAIKLNKQARFVKHSALQVFINHRSASLTIRNIPARHLLDNTRNYYSRLAKLKLIAHSITSSYFVLYTHFVCVRRGA